MRYVKYEVIPINGIILKTSLFWLWEKVNLRSRSKFKVISTSTSFQLNTPTIIQVEFQLVHEIYFEYEVVPVNGIMLKNSKSFVTLGKGHLRSRSKFKVRSTSTSYQLNTANHYLSSIVIGLWDMSGTKWCPSKCDGWMDGQTDIPGNIMPHRSTTAWDIHISTYIYIFLIRVITRKMKCVWM